MSTDEGLEVMRKLEKVSPTNTSRSPSHLKPITIMMFPSNRLDGQHVQAGAGGGGGRQHLGQQCRDHGLGSFHLIVFLN